MPTANLAIDVERSTPASGNAWRARIADKLASADVELPMLPRVATEVMQVASGADGDASRLSALIHRDPALAGAVLRVSNSPAYLPRTPIVSLQQAVIRLGFATLGDIALAASLQSGVFEVGRHEPYLQRLWIHALASGGFAREVARAKRANVENAFLCGLLHQIGMQALLQLVANTESDIGDEIDPDGLDAILDEFHVEIGSKLAVRWELPPAVCRALSHSRDAGAAATNDHALEAVVTATAHKLATHLLSPDLLDEEELRAYSGFAVLNLYPEDIDALLERSESVREFVDSMTA